MYCDFLIKRINDFYKNVIEVRKNKKHLVIGKNTKDDSLIYHKGRANRRQK